MLGAGVKPLQLLLGSRQILGCGLIVSVDGLALLFQAIQRLHPGGDLQLLQLAAQLQILSGCGGLVAQGFDLQRESWKERRPCVGADVLTPLLYPVTETLLDYLPEGSLILMNDPSRIADEAKAAELVFSETVAATLERGEGHAAQAKLLIDAEGLMRRLDTAHSAAYYALFRPYPNFRHRARVGFTAEPAPAYLNDAAQFRSELSKMLRAKEAVLLFIGEAQERLHPCLDPKCHWALRHKELFPLEVNRAPYEMLLRVPGIGAKSAWRITRSRRFGPLSWDALKKIGTNSSRVRTVLPNQIYQLPPAQDKLDIFSASIDEIVARVESSTARLDKAVMNA